MKTSTPWWMHLLVGVVIICTVLIAWHQWMLHTNDNPMVIMQKPICNCEPNWLDDGEKQAIWQDIIRIDTMIRALASGCMRLVQGVEKLEHEIGNTFLNMDSRNQRDFQDLRDDLKALEKRVTELEKKPKKRGCGE